MRLRFEWDSAKAESNIRKHRLPFEEAITVFVDPLAAIFHDEEHSGGENREIMIGRSVMGRLILVSFIQRSQNTVRIISARKATRAERRDYEENWN